MIVNAFPDFGSNAAVALAAGDIIARVIDAPTQGPVEITVIDATAWQNGSVFTSAAYIPVYVVLMKTNHFNDITAAATAVAPTSTLSAGFPTRTVLDSAQGEVLWQGHLSVFSPQHPLTFPPGTLKAKPGERLIVIACSPAQIDSTTTDNTKLVPANATLTVRGNDLSKGPDVKPR